MRRTALYAAFTISGGAGLVYESVWSRYLGLFVGHSAYAQVLVLSVYLGGMAVGALAVSDLTRRVANPLRWYVGAEVLLAGFGLAFHPVYLTVTGGAYDLLFPALPSPGAVGAARWGIAGLLLLPQSLVLGATFPLMAAALVRSDALRPGRGVATAYLWNTLGGAGGVLLAGFGLVAWVGLPGTVAAAALMNLMAAVLAFMGRAAVGRGAGAGTGEERHAPSPWSPPNAGVRPLLLTVAFGTAVASFAYEIGWIRMLSLALGSATHAFELMLSAFILGLALGSWLVRRAVDRTPDPLRLLGGIQILMGLAALATLPAYTVSFDAVGFLVRNLPSREDGYLLFNVSRYLLCLAVMLPATVLAGMTLPVLTGALMGAGGGERSIGRVYGVNTVGSVLGVGLAALVGLPLLGLKGLILAGAALDLVLGVWLLERSARWGRGSRRLALTASAAAGLALVAVGTGLRLDATVLTSGVFRYGVVPEPGAVVPLFYRDGRTATVSAHVDRADGNVVISTNGKPDASMGARWYLPGRDTLPEDPLDVGQDFSTQVLAPAVALAHMPGAGSVANIGHGSGMSAAVFLAHEGVRRVVTIEIEPAMVEGSLVFLPMNEAVFADARSTFAFDDAKSFFAQRAERFDIVFAEPSNPWVSGTASLFTREFYRRIAGTLSEEGILTQWMQIYEISDDLFLSVLAALDESFGSYRGYLVGDGDVVVVARARGALRDPDWSVLEGRGFGGITRGIPPFHPEHMVSLALFDETTFRPLLSRGVTANSDFHPILDLGAERARFLGHRAEGLFSLAANRLDLRRMLAEDVQPPLPFRIPPARGLAPLRNWGKGAWLRESVEAGGGVAPVPYPDWTSSLLSLRNFLGQMAEGEHPGSWPEWASAFDRAERELHWGTAGWADASFYGAVYAYLDRMGAPAEVRAAVDLMHGVSLFDWEKAAGAADALVGRIATGERWVRATVLLDAAVVSYLKTGRPDDARRALVLLRELAGRASWNARSGILEALVEEASPSGDR
jgi:predicted membrane-bound spermidine synthase